MNKDLQRVAFRSGFYIDGPVNKRGQRKAEYIAMRVAVPCKPIEIQEITWPEDEVKEKPGFMKILANMVAPSSKSKIEPQQSPKLPAPTESDITKTLTEYHVVDFRIPVKKDKEGFLVFDKNRLLGLEGVATHSTFSISIDKVMCFANPHSIYSQGEGELLPRLPEQDSGLLSLLNSVLFSTSDGVSMSDIVALRPIEKFLDDHQINFNGFGNPVLKTGIDLGNLDSDTKSYSQPKDRCRGVAENTDQYKFKSKWATPPVAEYRKSRWADNPEPSYHDDEKILLRHFHDQNRRENRSGSVSLMSVFNNAGLNKFERSQGFVRDHSTVSRMDLRLERDK